MSQPLRVAGFELIMSGRFWVIAKAIAAAFLAVFYLTIFYPSESTDSTHGTP